MFPIWFFSSRRELTLRVNFVFWSRSGSCNADLFVAQTIQPYSRCAHQEYYGKVMHGYSNTNHRDKDYWPPYAEHSLPGLKHDFLDFHLL